MADVITSVERVVLNSIPLATPAWRVKNVSELWQAADMDGRDQVIPGTHGARPYRRWRRPTRRLLELWVFGEYTREGVAIPNARQGLADNIEILRNGIGLGASGDGTVTCTVYLGDGVSTMTGPVHVEGFEWGTFAPPIVNATIELSIPAGELAFV